MTCPTSEVDIIDQHHGHCRVQVLHHIFNFVMCFTGYECVDFSCGLVRVAEVNLEDLARVEMLEILQELLQRLEAGAHGNTVANVQVLVLLAVAQHMEEMLVALIDLKLAQGAVAQGGQQLAVGLTPGPRGQHGQSGGDAKGRVEDVLPSGGLGNEILVEGKGKVGVGRGQRVAAKVSVVAVLRAMVLVVVLVVVCPRYSQQQQQRRQRTLSKDTVHRYSLANKRSSVRFGRGTDRAISLLFEGK